MFSAQAQSFPVLRHQQEIEHSFEVLPPGGCLIIHAEPGSGKTSLVPAMLAARNKSLAACNTGIILVTEPRRLAAVNAAKFASTLLETRQSTQASIQPSGPLNSQIGPDEIGYVVRGERNFGSATRVVYATEGMALVLLADPEFVAKLSCVVVDEFHERHATTDALLLVLRLWAKQIMASQQAPGNRNGHCIPKFVLMSATFKAERYAELFACQCLLRVPGQLFPVEITYREAHDAERENSRPAPAQAGTGQGLRRHGEQFAEFVGSAIHLELKTILVRSLQQTNPVFPHILVFLPGKGEIGRVKKVLEVLLDRTAAEAQLAQVTLEVDELHGELPLQKMMQSLEPVQAEDRKIKIFLSTNIAESSLTLPGVRIVIDSGLMRYARHHLGSGTLELGTTKVSQNSANQRAGRAGREGPGKVIRLFSETDYLRRATEQPPEICESDLSRDCLEILRVLASLKFSLPQNVSDWLALPWVDAPPELRLAQALSILRGTQALDASGRLSEKGLKMAAIPLPVRLGAVVLEARKLAAHMSKLKPQVFEILVTGLCSIIAEGDIYASQSAEHDDSLVLQLQAFLAKLAHTVHFGGFSFKAENYDQRAWHRVLDCINSICGKAFADFCKTLRADLSVVEDWKSDRLTEDAELNLGKCFFAGFFDAVARQSDRRSLEHMNGETFNVMHDLPGSGHGSYFLVLDGLRVHSNARAQSPFSKGSGSQSQALKIATKILSLPEEILFDGPEHLISERTEVREDDSRLQVNVSVLYGKLRIESETLSDSDARLEPVLKVWVSDTLLPRLFERKDMEAIFMRLRCAQEAKGKNSLALLNELNEIHASSPIVSRLFDFLTSSCRLSSKSLELSHEKICAAENLEKWLLDFETSRELMQLAPADLILANGKSFKIEYQWHATKGLSENPLNRGTADCRVREKGTQGRPTDEELVGFRIDPKEATTETTTQVSGKAQMKALAGIVQVRVVGRIQDFYGVKSHPQIGNIPKGMISVELLAPGGQTAQITSDLGQFWKISYPEVKKAYLGRYPKHYWPEDPATAKPFLTKRQEQGSRQ